MLLLTQLNKVLTHFVVKYYSPTTNICIIRVARDHHKTAWAGVTLLSVIEGVKYIPNVLHVSGENSRHCLCTPKGR
jgi:ribonuclease P/MRP protein subunit POP5